MGCQPLMWFGQSLSQLLGGGVADVEFSVNVVSVSMVTSLITFSTASTALSAVMLSNLLGGGWLLSSTHHQPTPTFVGVGCSITTMWGMQGGGPEPPLTQPGEPVCLQLVY